MARHARLLWHLGRRLEALPAVGSPWPVAPALATLTSARRPSRHPSLYGCHYKAGASPCGRRVKKNGGQATQALGRSRGGFSTKLHAGCISATTSVSLILSSGARHEAPIFDQVWDDTPELPALESAVLDKGYDSDHIRARMEKSGVAVVMPPKSNRKVPIAYDAEQYKLREKVERFFGRRKQFRRIATRYDKLSKTFLAFIHVVAAWISIK